jgi:hypothetical protein
MLNMPIDSNSYQSKENGENKEERQKELENLAGNYLITNWQLEEIGGRLARLGNDYDVDIVKGSSVVFKNGKDWFKLTVKLEKENTK